MSLHVAGPNNVREVVPNVVDAVEVTHCTMPATTVQYARHTANNCDAWEDYNARLLAYE